MLPIILLTLINISSSNCVPAQLLVVSKIEKKVYEVRISGTWPALLYTTTTEFARNGSAVIFVQKTGIKNLPTQNGFSQDYQILKQCPPNEDWGEE